MNYKRWNKITLTSIGIILVLIISFNYLIDPYFVFNSAQIDGFNKIKNNTISEQMTKFYTAKRSNAKVLILGTSRTEHINPNDLHKYIKGKIYNLAIPGSGIDVQKDNIEYFIKHSKLETIILGLDFFSFNPSNKSSYKTIKNTRYNDKYTNDYLDSILSISTLKKSIKTFKDNLKYEHNKVNYLNGWRNNFDYYKQLKINGIDYKKQKIEQQLNMISTQNVHFNNSYFKNPESILKSLENLEYIIKLCKINHIKLIMFISPLYYKITDMIYKKAYNKTYDFWKTQLSLYGTIYDFSGYNTISTNINNYTDGSHYKSKVAKLMFAKIFNDKSVDVPNDFGIILNKSNIGTILIKQKKSHLGE